MVINLHFFVFICLHYCIFVCTYDVYFVVTLMGSCLQVVTKLVMTPLHLH